MDSPLRQRPKKDLDMANDKTLNGDLSYVLETALGLVTGNRAEQHGDAYDQCTLAAKFWTTYLQGRGCMEDDVILEPHDVTQMMVLMKMSRDILGSFNPDTFVDQAGYSALSFGIKNRDYGA